MYSLVIVVTLLFGFLKRINLLISAFINLFSRVRWIDSQTNTLKNFFFEKQNYRCLSNLNILKECVTMWNKPLGTTLWVPGSPKFWPRICNAITRQPIELESCSNHLRQWFPTFLGLRHPTKQKYNFRHLVANPQQFGLSFGDILKISFQWYNKKRIISRHPWVLRMAPRGAAAPRLGTTDLRIQQVY